MGYDANGNMTTRGQDALAYDSENRLKEVKLREGTTGTTNYTLKAGWNVISFTHLPDNKSVSNVLSGLTFGTDYNQVSTWDSASGTWKHWVNDSDFNDFTEFQYGKTYEIYNNSGSDKSLSVTGTTNGADLTHNIVSGDNFISPAVKTATNVTTVLSGLTQGTHYSDVKRFNATTQTWESYAGSAFTQFEPGKGYNIIGLTNASFSYGKTETVTTFVYDANGDRVKKVAGGTTTTYLGKDYDVTGGTSTKYIFLGDRRLATKDSSGTLQFVHDDHISSSNVITDASGNQAGLYEYDPYGATVTHTGSADVKHQFTGQENDTSAKVYYYNARYYDPQLGRFISPDAYIQDVTDPQTFNHYAYCRNNPINYTDPTGNFFFIVAAIINAVVGIASAIGAAYAGAVASVSAALGIKGAMGAILSNAIVGGAWGSAMGAADGAINGTGVGRGALQGLIGGAVSGGIVGAGGNVLGELALKMSEEAIIGVARVALGSYQTYKAIENKSYFSATFAAINTIHTATIIADKINNTLNTDPGIRQGYNDMRKSEWVQSGDGRSTALDVRQSIAKGKVVPHQFENPDNLGRYLPESGTLLISDSLTSSQIPGVLAHEGTHMHLRHGYPNSLAQERAAFDNGYKVDKQYNPSRAYNPSNEEISQTYGF